MNEYTIYCTEEQTKKAIELGAPIMDYGMFLYDRDNEQKMIYKNEFGKDCYCHLPTAEQMIVWLEEKGVVITISHFHDENVHYVSKIENYFDEGIAYNSRKEATIAAIDAALECLSNQKNKQDMIENKSKKYNYKTVTYTFVTLKEVENEIDNLLEAQPDAQILSVFVDHGWYKVVERKRCGGFID